MKRAAGFSLVELMVALVLGLIVTGAVLASFAGSRSASRSTTGVSALTDSGRFAISKLGQSLRSAGYIACSGPVRQATILNIASPAPVLFGFGQAVMGYEASSSAPGNTLTLAARPAVASTSTGNWVGGLDATLLPGNPPGNPVAGSDIVVMHSTLPGTAPAYVTAIADGTDRFTVGSTTGFAAGQIAAISDCAKSVTFEITGVSGSDLVHAVGGAAPGNATFKLPISFGIGTQAQLITTTVYYIGVGADGDGALFSYDLNGTGALNTAGREIAPDIESMQVLYGIDTSAAAVGTVSQYVTADLVPDWTRVLAVQVAVLAASSPNAVTPPSTAQTFNLLGTSVKAPIDSRRRQVFTTSIALRNTMN